VSARQKRVAQFSGDFQGAFGIAKALFAPCGLFRRVNKISKVQRFFCRADD
jgi:hypothetical protein